MTLAAMLLLMAAAEAKTLIVYYSFTNNTHAIATDMQSQLPDADLLRIEPAEKGLDYAANGYAIGSALISAIRANPDDPDSYPAIDPVSVDFSAYNDIVVATPLWWSNMAAPMQTFLFANGSRMAGKRMALVVSSASSGISGVEADARRCVRKPQPVDKVVADGQLPRPQRRMDSADGHRQHLGHICGRGSGRALADGRRNHHERWRPCRQAEHLRRRRKACAVNRRNDGRHKPAGTGGVCREDGAGRQRHHGEGGHRQTPALDDDVARMLTDYFFGDIYTRGALDIGTRELLGYCILAAIGADSQLQSHYHGNIKAGNSPETVAAAIVQCLPYIGFPAAIKALKTIRQEYTKTAAAGAKLVRLSKIVVDPARIDEYNAMLKEEIETSVAVEPGVLTLYAMAEKDAPNKIAILEIYADRDAYESHLKTPHFIKYKQGTLDMVKDLQLIDTNPLIPDMKIK